MAEVDAKVSGGESGSTSAWLGRSGDVARCEGSLTPRRHTVEVGIVEVESGGSLDVSSLRRGGVRSLRAAESGIHG